MTHNLAMPHFDKLADLERELRRKRGNVTAEVSLLDTLSSMRKISPDDIEKVDAYRRDHNVTTVKALRRLNLVSRNIIEYALGVTQGLLRPSNDGVIVPPLLSVACNPYGDYAQYYHRIASRLQSVIEQTGKRIVAVNSVDEFTNGSVFTSNLACAFAVAGKRVLLVDLDFSANAIAGVFGDARVSGLAESDMSFESLRLSVAQTLVQKVDLLPSGADRKAGWRKAINPAFPAFVEAIAPNYDVVLVLAPADREAVNKQAVWTMASQVLALIKKNQTRLRRLRSLKKSISGSDADLIGSVVID